ncbi:MAG: DNA adenine methylase [Candidatus Glassbacteria bacterium]|nr:DNA adenine methylase [Candidatus Glassbacteria bacterium]
MIDATLTRPALRYRGGKWMIAPWIIAHLPPHECYVETHCGGASVLLRKPPADFEVLNDLDSQVVNFWRVLRERRDEFLQAIELTPWSRSEQLQAYQPSADPLESARRFYIRCWQGRGNSAERSGWRFQRSWSGWRVNKPRQFKEVDNLEWVVNRLAHVQLENRDALKIVEVWDAPGVLFYLDPPYVHSTRGRNRRLYREEMDDTAHVALADALRGIKGMAVVSGYDSPLYDRLFRGWRKESRPALGDQTKPTIECLWISPKADKAMGDGPLFDGIPMEGK